MTVQEWLERGRGLDNDIKQIKEDKENALILACGSSVDYGNEKVQTSSGNATERKFARYSELSQELDKKMAELERIKAEIRTSIDAVDDHLLHALLYARYINMKTWEQIAEDLGYSERWVRTGLHSRALQEMKSKK